MPLYEFSPTGITPIPKTTFGGEGIRERANIQAHLRDRVDAIAPDCMVLAEEFCDWDDSKRRIDLLCIDKGANLVVVELKRTEDGGAMELQSLRYAAMVSTMTFEQAVQAHRSYRARRGIDGDAQQAILEFLGWASPEEELFAGEVRIVLVAADFSREMTTAVLWLNERDLDIRCVQLRPYRHGDRILIEIEQVLPLKEVEEYQVRVRAKEREIRNVRESDRDYTKFDVTLDGVLHERLTKRKAVFHAVQHLCMKGRSPEEIADVAPWKGNRFWTTVPGTVDSSEYKRLARAARATFDPRRWYCDDDELIHSRGSTYALSNQWGRSTGDALRALQLLDPTGGLTVSESE